MLDLDYMYGTESNQESCKRDLRLAASFAHTYFVSAAAAALYDRPTSPTVRSRFAIFEFELVPTSVVFEAYQVWHACICTFRLGRMRLLLL